MSLYRFLGVVCLMSSLAACATTGEPSFPGRSLASASLKRETLESIRMRQSFSGSACSDNKVVDIQVIDQQVVPTYDGERPTAGKWTERWTVNQCGKVVQYKTEYSVNPAGAAVINLTPPAP